MKRNVLILAVLASLAACSDNHYQQPAQVVQPQVAPAPVVVQAAPVAAAPAPVIINQAPAASSGDHALTGALLGGAVGYMAGRASQPSAPTYVDRRPVVVNKTVVVKQYNAPKTVNVTNTQNTTKISPRPSYAPSPAPSRISLAKPASSSNSFGGFSRRK